MDEQAYAELGKLNGRISTKFPSGAMEILQTKNPEILKKINRLESNINSLVALNNKPKELKKDLANAMVEYERVWDIAIAYVFRHKNLDKMVVI